MNMRPLVVIFSLLISSVSYAAQTGKAQTTGNCSPAILGSNNSINLNCSNALEAKKVLEILNEILANQSVSSQSASGFGNISDRAIDVANKITNDLYTRGWRDPKYPSKGGISLEQVPNTPKGIEEWTRSVSAFFRFRDLINVVKIRNEYAQLHLRDARLDEFLTLEGATEQGSQMVIANPYSDPAYILYPQEIEEIADRLKILANNTRQRETPKSLSFSVAEIKPQLLNSPYDRVLTITTNQTVARGYIVMEFNEPFRMAKTDLRDAVSVMADEVEGDDPLRYYLRLHQAYAIKMGNPLTPDQSVHIFFLGITDQIKVIKVTWFDE